MNTLRTSHHYFTIAMLGGLAAGLLTGCAEKKEADVWSYEHPLPSRDENTQSAQGLLRDAKAAENRGDYARAVEVYTQLQSFPDYARPEHLDQRIHDAKIKGARGG